MKIKGFTLVELIAVIVILGLIGIIIVPIINSTIEKQREKSFQNSVFGLLAVVKSESQNNGFTTKVYRFDTDKLYACDENRENCSTTTSLSTDGKIKSGEGYVKVTKEGLYSLSIKNNDYCSFKTYYNDIVVTDNSNYCDFGNTIANSIDEALYYSNDGLNRGFYLNSGLLSLVNQNGSDIVPAIEIKTGFLTTAEGYFEVAGFSLSTFEIETSNFCALYTPEMNDEIIKFYDHDCNT